MRLFLECTPDQTLVVAIGVSRRDIIHSHSKGRVAKALAKYSGVTGLVDEDPGEPEPATLRAFVEVPASTAHDLKLKMDKGRGNRLVVICPRLEPWLIKTAKAANVKMDKHGLSDNLRDLDENIILRLANVERLLNELMNLKSPRLLHLKSLLVM